MSTRVGRLAVAWLLGLAWLGVSCGDDGSTGTLEEHLSVFVPMGTAQTTPIVDVEATLDVDVEATLDALEADAEGTSDVGPDTSSSPDVVDVGEADVADAAEVAPLQVVVMADLNGSYGSTTYSSEVAAAVCSSGVRRCAKPPICSA